MPMMYDLQVRACVDVVHQMQHATSMVCRDITLVTHYVRLAIWTSVQQQTHNAGCVDDGDSWEIFRMAL